MRRGSCPPGFPTFDQWPSSIVVWLAGGADSLAEVRGSGKLLGNSFPAQVELHRVYRSHSFNPSTTRSISSRFFSKSANVKMIIAPVTMPATYHNQVQPKFAEA